jgi:Legionella pneumophila major outer membrane protein precursor
MVRSVRVYVGALVAGFVWAGWGLAQYAPPPPPPLAAKPPAQLLPPSADMPPPPPPIADMTPPEFATKPVTTTCDGCRPGDSPAAWLFSADYLLERPRRRADDYAIVDPVDNLTPEGSVKNIGFDLASGLRAGIGYRAAGSSWETWFTYTYLSSSGNASAVAPNGGLLYADLTRPGLVDTALFATATDTLTYNVYDMDTMQRVAGDDRFCLKIGFGARYANIDMNQGAFYDGRDANAATVASRVTFNGAGLTASGEGRWALPWGFSAFGRAKAGLVVGDVHNSLRETNNGGLTTNADISEQYYATIPVLEMGSGFSWDYRSLRISAGYEMTNWFNMVDTPTFTNDFAEGKIGRRRSDLSLDGLFVQMSVAY